MNDDLQNIINKKVLWQFKNVNSSMIIQLFFNLDKISNCKAYKFELKL